MAAPADDDTATQTNGSWEQALQEAQAAAVPAELRGFCAAWPACRLWAGSEGLRYLASTVGEAAVSVRALWRVHAQSSASVCCTSPVSMNTTTGA